MLRAVLFDMYETLCSHYRCPLYLGAEIADDCGVSRSVFLPLWRDAAMERARTLGQLTLEAQLNRILPLCGISDPALLARRVALVCEKRSQTKAQCLRSLHPEVLPMLWGLKARGIRLGLISNCYPEEAQAIRAWTEGSCFDAMLLSCEQGLAKPDAEIYRRCMAALRVAPEECLFVGDGGSRELEAAAGLGITPLQAAWYILETEGHPSPLTDACPRLSRPMQVLDFVCCRQARGRHNKPFLFPYGML